MLEKEGGEGLQQERCGPGLSAGEQPLCKVCLQPRARDRDNGTQDKAGAGSPMEGGPDGQLEWSFHFLLWLQGALGGF